MSVTHDFKFEAPDGKKRAADALDYECVEILAKHYPNNRANAFLDWFTYSDNTIDGQSKKKAYTFMESNLVSDEDVGTVKSLQQIHAYIFGGIYDFCRSNPQQDHQQRWLHLLSRRIPAPSTTRH